jgi:hypothetical protein
MRPTDTCTPTRHTGEWGACVRSDRSVAANAPAAWALQGEEPAACAAAPPPQPSPVGPPRPRVPPPAAAAGCSPTRPVQLLRTHDRTHDAAAATRSPHGPTRTMLAAPAVQQPLQLHRSTPRLSVRGRAQLHAPYYDFSAPLAILLIHVEPAARWVALDLLVGRLERPCALNHTATSMHAPHTTASRRTLAQATYPALAASP